MWLTQQFGYVGAGPMMIRHWLLPLRHGAGPLLVPSNDAGWLERVDAGIVIERGVHLPFLPRALAGFHSRCASSRVKLQCTIENAPHTSHQMASFTSQAFTRETGSIRQGAREGHGSKHGARAPSQPFHLVARFQG